MVRAYCTIRYGEVKSAELKEGMVLAKRAIKKDPSYGMGYATLALAEVLSGNPADGISNAKRAVTVQPGDAFAHFIFGMSLILAQKPDEALEPLLEALRLDPVEPRTPYINLLGLAYFAGGEYSLALDMFDRNDEWGGPTGPHKI